MSRAARSTTPLRRVLSALSHSPLAMAGLGWLVLLVVTGLFASVVAPYPPLAQNLNLTDAGPSLQHLLGTDNLGRDILSRMMFGTVPIVVGSLLTTVVAIAVGLPLGLAAGYFKGWVDGATLWIADLSFAVPSIVVLLAVAVITNQNLWWLTIVFGLIASGMVVRLVRPIANGVSDLPYVDAARLSGLSSRRSITRHVLPATIAPVIVAGTQVMSVAIVVIASLSYLGLGGSPEQPTWGAMLALASQNLTTDAWLLVPVGGALILTVLALTFVGSTVRDAVWSVAPATSAGSALVGGKRAPHRSIRALGAADGPRALAVVPPLLAVRDLVVSFDRGDGAAVVVDGVSLELHRSEVRGVVGESGCGKTVTALSIARLLPPGGHIVAGSIELDGLALCELGEMELARLRGRRLGLISQQPLAALDPSFTVRSQLSEVVRVHAGCTRAEAKRRAVEKLEEVGLADPRSVGRKFPHQISGGMAQRVAIAIALAGEPDLLIADEPTTALDVTIQAEILDLLRTVVTRRAMGLLIVTHDFGFVADICDSVTVMYAGQVVEEGPASAVLGRPVHPYTEGLLASTPELGRRPGPLHVIEGTVVSPEDWPVGCRFANRCAYALEACAKGSVDMIDLRGRSTRCIRSQELLVGTHQALDR